MKRAVWIVVPLLAILVGYALFHAMSADPIGGLYALKPYNVVDAGPRPERTPNKKIRTFYFQGKSALDSLDLLKKSLVGRHSWYLRSSGDNYAFFSNTKLAGQGSEIDWFLTDDASGKAIVHVVEPRAMKLQIGDLTVTAGPGSGLPPIKLTVKDKYDAQLGMAAQQDDLSSAEDAIKHGAHVNPLGKDEFSPLYWALTGKGTRVAELLVAHGADLNYAPVGFGGSLVAQLASEGHPDAVRFLVRHGAKFNKSLILFQVANVKSPVDSLLDWPEMSFFDDGWIADDGWKNSGACAQALIDGGAVVNAKDENGNTVLAQAAENGNASLVQVLLDNGAILPKSADKIVAVTAKRHRNSWRKVLALIQNRMSNSPNPKP